MRAVLCPMASPPPLYNLDTDPFVCVVLSPLRHHHHQPPNCMLCHPTCAVLSPLGVTTINRPILCCVTPPVRAILPPNRDHLHHPTTSMLTHLCAPFSPPSGMTSTTLHPNAEAPSELRQHLPVCAVLSLLRDHHRHPATLTLYHPNLSILPVRAALSPSQISYTTPQPQC